MLTFERHEKILNLLEKQKVAKLAELVEETGASESTIRRDLTLLENDQKLKRIHGGASLLKRKVEEPSMAEKQTQFTNEKKQMGKRAAGLIQDGDCVYIDAGTSTQAMIPYIGAKDVVIVTNGLNIIEESLKQNFRTYVVGGYIKSGTRAFIGKGAVQAISEYRFDKAFIGTNGIDLDFGYSTPDPEEAQIKNLAIKQSNLAYVLADSSKFGDVTFAKFAELEEAGLITTEGDDDDFVKKLKQAAKVEVVKTHDLHSDN
ncbi:DeoR/GlpR family DNA-binding transcription regulator [Salipaludibacillus sp. CUR1]|uniref:DeoR/GlpR family DNA-binding transcription regulator n=1 Tax=Salipaludibacillus sp. CUR1 TaxID=2820003 RepID=UPI001E4E36E5|nr:DeoR/GlpR family DNA-binding transcription regulator [Salipaludibacillus sp. CUR1]MCE7791493.1 DeoR/GlpR family DNA-binding transcription regulator [Salipaludibacillus sp. CUR1]